MITKKYAVIITSEYNDVFLSGVEIEQLIYAEMQRRFPERFMGVYDETKYDVECQAVSFRSIKDVE